MKNRMNDIRDAVRERYSNLGREKFGHEDCGCTPQAENGCCAPAKTKSYSEVSSKLGYSDQELRDVPEGSNLGLGCGNPQAIAALKKGETVLDLGSGAGFDAFLAANQVGKKGKVVGVDMTPKMINKARENAEKGNYTNVEFRLGEIENLPVRDNSIDVIISNCVINLSPEKQKVFNDSFRVLTSGGRIAVSDVVATADLPNELKNDLDLYSSCVAGSSSIDEIDIMLKKAGFVNVIIKPKDESRAFILDWASGTKISDYITSATIEAVKP